MCTTDQRMHRESQRGASFVELIIFIVIVGLAVAGVLLVINTNAQHSADPQLRKQALAIAESLLEEVEMARFTYCNPADPQAQFATTAATTAFTMGPQPVGSTNAPGYCSSAAMVENFAAVSGTRPYGNVINYVPSLGGTTTYSTTAGTLTDSNGSAIPNLAGTFTATITIKNGTALGSSTGTTYSDPGANPAIPGALQITVTVTDSQGDAIVLDGYRTQYAPQLMP